MEFYGLESRIVDLLATPELQRLRRIRQLGLGLLVFPAAEHSRLAHSIGASFVAVRFGRELQHRTRSLFIDELAMDEAATRDLATAALCHDLGHGPLSHAWEREILGENFDRRGWCQALGLDWTDVRLHALKWHELVGQGLLAWEHGSLHRLLEADEAGLSRRIRELILGKYYLPYVPRLISGDVDVDRCDFVKRDAHQTGVAYGRYDLDWLISTATIGEAGDSTFGGVVVGFEERKAIRVVEQFLIARRAMYDTVYHHKTVRCAEGMVALFLRRMRNVLREGARIPTSDYLNPLMRIVGGEPLEPSEIVRLDDFGLMVLVESVTQLGRTDKTAQDLARRLSARELFKMVRVDTKKLSDFLQTDNARSRLYEVIRPYCGGRDPEFYLVEDRTRFDMMASYAPKRVFLVRSTGDAIAAWDHEAFAHYRSQEIETVRLFTIEEARLDVENYITHGQSM
jgi:HD superfamily phosphohydrolase